METNQIVTYRFYSSKKQRLAIMANKRDGVVDIIIVKCSKKDAFNKKLAREVLTKASTAIEVRLYGVLYHPERITIPVKDNWKNDFFDWASKEYSKRVFNRVTYWVEGIHINGKGFEPLNSSKTFSKW